MPRSRPYAPGDRVRVRTHGHHTDGESGTVRRVDEAYGGHFDHDYEGWRSGEPARVWVRLDARPTGYGYLPKDLEPLDSHRGGS